MMDEMPEKELDRLLQHATKPKLPDGFEERMRAKLVAVPKSAEVIPFRPRTAVTPVKKSGWLVGVPLAASLLLGVALGVQGTGSTMFGDETETAFAGDEISTGFEEAEEAAEEDAT